MKGFPIANPDEDTIEIVLHGEVFMMVAKFLEVACFGEACSWNGPAFALRLALPSAPHANPDLQSLHDR